MKHSGFEGYDIIGDVHGCADELERLLDAMGYRPSRDAAYEHPSRQAIFVGDLIDRGPEQLRVLEVVKSMVVEETARMVLGNHEFNAMAYHTEWPAGSGKYLRPHDDPDNTELSAKNRKQHREFLEQLGEEEQREYLEWFWKQPLWLDLGDIRVIHACWHQPSIDRIAHVLGGSTFTETDIEQFARASDRNDQLYTDIETILKGPEISLVEHGQEPYRDKDGHTRQKARLRWWHSGADTLRGLAEMGGNFSRDSDNHEPYPELPDIPVANDDDYVYTGNVPVFYGHYWRSGSPAEGQDFTGCTACVDFSAVKANTLTAYRWSGEHQINPDNYVHVDARESLNPTRGSTEGEES